MQRFNQKYCGLVLFFMFCSQGSRCNILHINGHLESRSLKITLLSNYANCIGGGLQQVNNLAEEEDSPDILNRIFNSPLFESNFNVFQCSEKLQFFKKVPGNFIVIRKAGM